LLGAPIIRPHECVNYNQIVVLSSRTWTCLSEGGNRELNFEIPTIFVPMREGPIISSTSKEILDDFEVDRRIDIYKDFWVEGIY
jgi:hypothetical protein